MDQLPHHEPAEGTRTFRRLFPSSANSFVGPGRKITRGTRTMMLMPMVDARAEDAMMAGAQGDRQKAVPINLSHRILPTGEAVASIEGELDFATADMAVQYIRQVIDRHHGPVNVDLTSLRFCDARGLSALLRMFSYAEQADCPFRLASPSPFLIKLMRITNLDRRLLAP
jgi:anti-sigma B factor antagonist